MNHKAILKLATRLALQVIMEECHKAGLRPAPKRDVNKLAARIVHVDQCFKNEAKRRLSQRPLRSATCVAQSQR